jgi:O-acetylserine/cysteine efflux transporter
VAVGLFLGAGQFGLLFVGMARGAPAGLASLVLQAQAVFTLAFAALVLRERPTVRQLAGVGTATAGLVVIAVGRGAGTPLLALLLVVAAAACWGAGNVCTRLARAGNGLSLVVWSALVPPVPLAVLSLLVEGPAADARAFATVSWSEVGALLYVVVLASLVGYGTWTMLLREYPASTVAPLSLLVPVVGIAAAWLLDGETPGPVELAGAAVVLAGLALVSVRRRPEVRPLVQARQERVRG